MTKKQQTRQKIINVSKNYFMSKGYKDTLISDIASEIKIDRRTVYRHFESKELILLEILSAAFKDFSKHLLETEFKIRYNVFEKIDVLFDKYFDYFKTNNYMFLLVGMLDRNLSTESRNSKSYLCFIETSKVPDVLLGELIQEGIDNGMIRNEITSEITAISINNALLSLASRIATQKEKLDNEQHIESWKMLEILADLLISGLKND